MKNELPRFADHPSPPVFTLAPRAITVSGPIRNRRWFGAGAPLSSSTAVVLPFHRTTTSVAVTASDFPTRTKNGTPFQRGESIVKRRTANVSVVES